MPLFSQLLGRPKHTIFVRDLQLSSVLENMKQETALLRAQVGRERESSKSLETLLHSNREKEFHAQLTQQEKDAEIQLLKDRLSISESKL